MSTLWLHSRQDIRDTPITTAELRRLADRGGIHPQDLVLRVGTDRWVAAGKVEGLFNAGRAEWYFTHGGRTYGPVTLHQLWDAVAQRCLTPDDYVIKVGMTRWKSATKVVGLFPEPVASVPRTAPGSDPSKRPGNPKSGAWGVGDETPVPGPRTVVSSPTPQPLLPPDRTGDPRAAPPHPDRASLAEEPSRPTSPRPAAGLGYGPAMTLARHVPSLLLSLVLLGLAAVGAVWSVPSPRPPQPRTVRAPRPPEPEPEARGALDAAAADLQADSIESGRVRPARWDVRPISRASAPSLPREPLLAGGDSLPLARLGSTRSRGTTSSPLGSPAARLSAESERRLGQAMYNRILREHPVLETEGLREQVEQITRPLLAGCRRTDIDDSVTILDDPEVFAFSHLGGYVYLSRGMVELATSEAELQYVIGHELAHLELRHGGPEASRIVGEARLRGPADAGLAPRLLRQAAERYDAEEELAADAWVVENFLQRGVPAEECLAVPKRYLAYLRQHAPDRAGRPVETESTPSLQGYDRHWNHAPSTIERLEQFPSLVARVAARGQVAPRRAPEPQAE